MTDPRIFTPEEAQEALDRGAMFPSDARLLLGTVATEPDRIRAARVESYNQGYVEGFEKASEGERRRTRAAVVEALAWVRDDLGVETENDDDLLLDRIAALKNGEDW